MPCNTLHTLLPKLKKITKIKFLDLVDETSKIIKQKYKKIAVLSSTKTRKERLYDQALEKIEIIYPSNEEQQIVSKIIIRIIANKATEKDKNYLENLIQNLINQGAEKVILACTDLGNLIQQNKHTLDTTNILIESIIKEMKLT